MEIKIKRKMYKTYYILLAYFIFFIVFGFIMSSPHEILEGFKKILFQSNILITDYIELGGIGAAFINSGLLSITCLFIIVMLGLKPNGAIVAALWLISGFGLFGKNIINVWPVIFGVWLYSKYQKEHFLNYVLIALFGTTLSPTFNEFSFTGIFPLWQGIIFGILTSVFIGFILPPLASYCIKLHQGYSLYNTGFAAGLLGTVLMSFLRLFGINFNNRLLWSTGHNLLFGTFLSILFISMIIIGYILNNKSFKNLFKILEQPGRLITDFFLIYGKGSSFINMGILGLVFTVFIVVIGADLNGPTIGGIFTIVGFGSFGKHIKNTIPVALGALLASFLSIWNLTSPGLILAILFSTNLAPISGHFGWEFGMISGFIHVCIVMQIGYLHGGINLYNNGFSGGIVAIILVPIISAFRQKFISGVDELKKDKDY
ncbi:hypothetical protein CLTEP_23430 [Clostridium tepidiprofundi DSM 19306]|uniref:DUF1576 domain-containing protein n=1 Tax=Clostridium tepidiprofundi DSM 19306 TaxID=1121338 RepID=A0A151AVV5_9CLOT|nr:DUF1576 domain-containing protein [Clostridium tepidiprofundi]KYH31680.1 hypothetical protein CLTEP_23430 [Clostridium tepidiprofundi DSM 19306]